MACVIAQINQLVTDLKTLQQRIMDGGQALKITMNRGNGPDSLGLSEIVKFLILVLYTHVAFDAVDKAWDKTVENPD